jgi:hypothetical protein
MASASAVCAVLAVLAPAMALALWQPPAALRQLKAIEASPLSDLQLPKCDLAVVLSSRERVSLAPLALAKLVDQQGVCHFHMVAAIPDLPLCVCVCCTTETDRDRERDG